MNITITLSAGGKPVLIQPAEIEQEGELAAAIGIAYDRLRRETSYGPFDVTLTVDK